MNLIISTTMNKVTEENKGLEIATTKHLKTKTNIDIKLDDKSTSGIVPMIAKDIATLKLQGEPLHNTTLTVEGAAALGKLINRSVLSLAKVGVNISEIGWDDKAGLVTVSSALGLVGSDFPILAEILARIVARSTAAISGTQHPFTLFDLKQAMGIVYDAKQEDATAKKIEEWMTVRELSILEEIKAAKAKVKATAKAATDKEKKVANVKAAEKTAAAPKVEEPEKNAKGKGKSPIVAKQKVAPLLPQ